MKNSLTYQLIAMSMLAWGLVSACNQDEKKSPAGPEAAQTQTNVSASQAANAAVPTEQLLPVLQTWSQEMVKAFPDKFVQAEATGAQLVVFYWNAGVKPEERSKQEQSLIANLQIRLVNALAEKKLNPGLASTVRFKFDQN